MDSYAIKTPVREPEFFGRIAAVNDIWEGFMNNLYFLSEHGVVKSRPMRHMHFFEQLFGAGKSRTAYELVNSLNSRFTQISHSILAKTDPTDEKKRAFISSMLCHFKEARLFNSFDPQGLFEYIILAIHQQMKIDTRSTESRKFEVLVSQLFDLFRERDIKYVVLHIDEIVPDRLYATDLIRMLVILEETALCAGIYLQCILSGCRSKMFMYREEDVFVRMKWIYLEPLELSHVRNMWENVKESLVKVNISDEIQDYFIERLYCQTGIYCFTVANDWWLA
jgi:hypothetical protein